MKYSIEIIINLPREEVIEKMDNPDNLKHWQKGKRDMTLIETILKRNFPEEFHATYDTKGVHNIQNNYFEELDDIRTKWISESEFQFSGSGMKLMGWLMPGAFKKQSKKYMNDFKNFAEKGISVANK